MILVSLGARSYPVVVARDALPALAARVRELAPTSVVLVTDRNVAREHLTRVRAALAGSSLAAVEAIEPGERSKTLATVEALCRRFLAAGLDRRGLVVALGGGVVGDVAGFAAATWLRGTAVVHVPTSLLAMVDSAVGGKTGVDLEGKNLVGAFHQPSGVFASLELLETLPERELRGGLGEVLKTAFLSGEELLARVEREAPRLVARDLGALEPVVLGCAAHKAGVVTRDEREEGERALLNLGHTLGHALEALDGFSGALLHGEAVAIGMHFALRLSARLGLCREATVERVVALTRALGLPATRPGFPVEEALALMRRDKKAVGGSLRFVLARAPGTCELSKVEDAVVRAELERFTLPVA